MPGAGVFGAGAGAARWGVTTHLRHPLAVAPGWHVFVIDNSYSRCRTSPVGLAERPIWIRAKLVAGEMIDRLSSGGESVVIITAGKPAAGVIAKPTYDLQQAKSILNRIPQSYGAQLIWRQALRMAIDVGRENERQPNKNLYLFTDATASCVAGGRCGGVENRRAGACPVVSCFAFQHGRWAAVESGGAGGASISKSHHHQHPVRGGFCGNSEGVWRAARWHVAVEDRRAAVSRRRPAASRYQHTGANRIADEPAGGVESRRCGRWAACDNGDDCWR